MDVLRSLIENLREVRGAYQVAALAVLAAVIVAFTAPLVSIGILLVALAAFLYGLLIGQRGGVETEPSATPAVNPARGTLFAVADDHLPQERPPGVTELDWILFRHLKSDPSFGLGKAGDIPARYFVDLREAALIPAQCDCLSRLLCDQIREEINIENHHGLIIPKNGNVNLGMAVARELGLAPVLVRDWPFYGRWIETLVTSGRAIAIDDVSTQGELIVEAVEHARDAGFVVNRAFLLIRRGEGAADSILEQNRLSLSAVLTLSDADLDELVARVRSA